MIDFRQLAGLNTIIQRFLGTKETNFRRIKELNSSRDNYWNTPASNKNIAFDFPLWFCARMVGFESGYSISFRL